MTKELTLIGLDPSNPLAFLAALGALRSLSVAQPDASVRLHWRPAGGALRPVLTSPTEMTEEAVLTVLLDRLRSLGRAPALAFANDLAVSQDVFRKAAIDATQHISSQDQDGAGLIAAFASDAIADPKTGIVQDTAWRTMSGAGHQHFLGFMRTLAAEVTAENLSAALFSPWEYSDPPPSLRWDPMDDRRYALRWNEPSGDPIRTVRGANALAIQGLPLFPSQPGAGALGTTGFSRVPRKGTFFTWPIWKDPLTSDVVRSLLALREIQAETPPRERLGPLGIVEVYRSQRITQGKYRNFTQGVPA